MSIILTSGKKSAKKLQKIKVAKKPNKASNSVAAFDAYLPSPNTVVWNYKLDGQQLSIAFCKDTVSIWCNDVLINADGDFVENGSELNFILFEHKAQLRIRSRRPGSPTTPGEGSTPGTPGSEGTPACGGKGSARGGGAGVFSQDSSSMDDDAASSSGGATQLTGGGSGASRQGGAVEGLIDSFNDIMTAPTSGQSAAGGAAVGGGGGSEMVYELRIDGMLIAEHKPGQRRSTGHHHHHHHHHRGPFRNESTSSLGSAGSLSSQ